MRTYTGLAVLILAAAAPPPALAAGDAAAGQTLFKVKCATCHTVTAGQNKLGPSMAGVLGRKAGAVAGYAYSPANRGSAAVWDAATLDAYLVNPRGWMPGTKMIFAGLPNGTDRANVIAYLATLR